MEQMDGRKREVLRLLVRVADMAECGADDAERLTKARRLQAELSAVEADIIARMRNTGTSWRTIAQAAGLSAGTLLRIQQTGRPPLLPALIEKGASE